jgi:hypothetical protein
MTLQSLVGNRLEKARIRFVGRFARKGIALDEILTKQVTDKVNLATDRPSVLAAADLIAALLTEVAAPTSKDLVLEAMACFHGHPTWDSLSARLPKLIQAKPRQLPARLWTDNRWNSVEMPFGLYWGQMHSVLDEDRKLTHNSAWLNREGDQIGFGDLSEGDMVRIALGIEPGELFLVLPEKASDPDEWARHIHGTEARPSLDYIVERVFWMVEPGAVHEIPRFSEPDETRRKVISGVLMDEIGRERIAEVLAKTHGGPVTLHAHSR